MDEEIRRLLAVDGPEPETTAHRVVRFGVIPLALLVGLVALFVVLCGAALLVWAGAYAEEDRTHAMHPRAAYPLPWQTAQRQRLEAVLAGNPRAADYPQRLRALWARAPEDKAAYARYALAVYTREDGYTPAFEAVMREGQRVDPDNALYHYLLARKMLGDAVSGLDGTPTRDDAGAWQYPYSVKDRALLDRAMAEVRAGAKKPALRGYHMTTVDAQLAAMPPPRQFEGHLFTISVGAVETFPEYPVMRTLIRTLPWYAGLLAQEGKGAEAPAILGCWKPMVHQLTGDSDTLIAVLVAGALAKITADQYPPTYRAVGRADLAAQTQNEAGRVFAAFQRYRVQMKSPEMKAFKERGKRTGGIMPAILLPVFGHIPTETEMTPMRLVDYALAERLALTVAIVLLFGLVLYFLAVGYRWQAVSRSMEETPRLVLLSAREWVAVLLAAVAPLALYLVYARFSGFAGRELSLVANLPRFPLDLLATFILAIVLPLWLARRILRRRCVEQGITAPSPALERVSRLLGTPGAAAWSLYCGYMVLFTLLLACFPMPAMGQMTTEAWASRAQPLSLLLSTAFLLLFLGGLHFIPLLWSMRQRALAPYFGTLARSLAPVAAVLLLLAAGVLYPALRAEERALIQRDTLIFYHPGQPRTGLTPVEARVCEEVRGELLEAFGE